MLGCHLSALACELQQTVLVNGLFQSARQRQVADGFQSFQVGQHMLWLRRAGRSKTTIRGLDNVRQNQWMVVCW